MTNGGTNNDPTSTGSELQTLANPKWIRGHLNDVLVVDSRDALLVWEIPYYPQWYFPITDVFGELRPTGRVESTDNRGEETIFDLVVGDTALRDAARQYSKSPGGVLDGRVRLDWDALDNWLEEEVEVIVHPRSPFSRTDVLPSTRHVQVFIDGNLVADSHSPTVLFETGLPTRYYLPPNDVRLDLLHPTDTHTGCPYKGIASYWSVTVGDTEYDDIVWGYPSPLPEARDVAGMLCFFNEKVDIEVDGVAEPRPMWP